ncbi:hypothetical protein ACVWZM_004857 [Bradyrhizobium sp. USDA 4501]
MAGSLVNTRRRYPGLLSVSFRLEEGRDMSITPERQALLAEVWTVLTAARDLGDIVTQLVARRIVDAHLNNRQPLESDIEVTTTYFR